MDKIWDNYSEIRFELEKITKIMKKETKCRDKVIESSIFDLIESGGKMLRPAFVVIGSRFGEYNEERVRALAAVLELLHMATLVHDDVIDDAKLRRGQETIQSKYGKDYAVYIGDYLFCVCFKILASNASLASIKMDVRAMSRICMGEIDQLNSRFTNNMSVKNYLSRVSGKTAELFSLSLYLGAAESNCDKKLAKQLSNIGHNIGMAFQIIDDVLDYTGNDESIKKSAANDLKQGIFTIPFIYAYREDKNSFNKYINNKSISDEDIKEILYLVKEKGGIEKARGLAKKYTDKAFKGISNLPENEYKYILKDIATMLILRTY